MTDRLSEETLSTLPKAVRRPRYDRGQLTPGVVHIGPGSFHRAHQAPVFEKLAEAGDYGWGIIGASLQSTSVRDALVPQGGLYSLTVEDSHQHDLQIVSSILDVIVAPEAPKRLVAAIASPGIHLVTVTVTEKGYKLDLASGQLDEGDDDVRADMRQLDSPRTMPGFLASALKMRREKRLPPLTVLSCDNLAANGTKLRSAVRRISLAHDPALADWIDEGCSFPNSMVDRIVPAATQRDIERASTELGVIDRAAVRTEPFSQWVIEDRFAGARPDLELGGVQLASNVAPWEEAKLRILNGAHSAMAYLGGLAGMSTVDEFVSQPWGRAYLNRLWDELASTLRAPPGLDIGQYRNMLMWRFENAALGHGLSQIAMDGSQKIPQRLLPAARSMVRGDQAPKAVAIAIAAWIRWQNGRDESGHQFDVDDPLASVMQRALDGMHTPAEQVRAIFSLVTVFPPQPSDDEHLEALVAQQLELLHRFGTKATVEQLLVNAALGAEDRP